MATTEGTYVLAAEEHTLQECDADVIADPENELDTSFAALLVLTEPVVGPNKLYINSAGDLIAYCSNGTVTVEADDFLALDADGNLSVLAGAATGYAVKPQAALVADESTADGSDAATTQALANALKDKVNEILGALQDAGLMATS